MPSRPWSRRNRHEDGVQDYEPSSRRKLQEGVQDYEPSSNYKSLEYERGDIERLKYADYKPSEEDDEGEDVYIVKQNYGYFSILFSVVQTIILGVMMWQCGVAPLNINPMLGPYPDALSEWGGKNSVLILEENQWYRLVTPIFLHAGVIHLVGNVAVQLEMGYFFEREWTSLVWFIIYIVSAFGSSILSVIAMPTAVSVGSSGAVMGLFGGKLAEIMLRACERKVTRHDRVAHEVRREQCMAVSCSVVVVMLFSFIPFVDWAAHLGGVLAGFAVGIMVFAVKLETLLWKSIWLSIGAALTIGGFAASLKYMYSGNIELIDELKDVCGYYMQNMEGYECNCMREEYFANNGGGGGDNLML